jgi:hypothetical protein
MAPSVMRAVTGQQFSTCKVALRGYARYKVKDAFYPGIIRKSDAMMIDTIHLDVDGRSLMLLDHFEGDLYARTAVEVESEQGLPLSAETYVIKPEHEISLSYEPWDPEDFERNHLQDFIENYEGFSVIREDQ